MKIERALLLVLAALLCGTWIGRAHAEDGVVDARKILLRDASGKVRLQISVEKSGAGLSFLAPDGRREGFLTVAAGEVGKTTVAETGTHNTGLYLYDAKGAVAWHAP
jgi:hypothetical protein